MPGDPGLCQEYDVRRGPGESAGISAQSGRNNGARTPSNRGIGEDSLTEVKQK